MKRKYKILRFTDIRHSLFVRATDYYWPFNSTVYSYCECIASYHNNTLVVCIHPVQAALKALLNSAYTNADKLVHNEYWQGHYICKHTMVFLLVQSRIF